MQLDLAEGQYRRRLLESPINGPGAHDAKTRRANPLSSLADEANAGPHWPRKDAAAEPLGLIRSLTAWRLGLFL
jgi:hypothetical protein